MTNRSHPDRCPGVLRPWIAGDGAIVRLRLVGGVLQTSALRDLVGIAADYADGTILLTKRTNLQLRGIDHSDGCVPAVLVDAIAESGLLPSPSHELVRNIMVSPLTGRVAGRADLRETARTLDHLLCAEPDFAALAGRFLFVLDDGRGDVSSRSLDLGLMAVDAETAQLRAGSHHWGPLVPLDEAPGALLSYAAAFLASRGDGETALWHVDELPEGGAELLGIHHARDLRTQVSALPPPYGIIAQDDGRSAEHLAVPDGLLTPELAAEILGRAGSEVIVTPWRSIVIPDLESAP
ncbi:nitrite reductase [Aeromicrobium sp. NPDC092404]|uniref:nitrite reductase n=1 Tax=Aeromicrobium sp. NPDC092404 TaxID=3154976 RepID=UPI0034226CFB